VNFHFDFGGFAPVNSKKCDAGMIEVVRLIVISTRPPRPHVRENNAGNLKMAASLDFLHFQPLGWK
jgi:hypothetical protein